MMADRASLEDMRDADTFWRPSPLTAVMQKTGTPDATEPALCG